jgi:hypothetical protein
MIAKVERENSRDVGLAVSARLPEVARDRTNLPQQRRERS